MLRYSKMKKEIKKWRNGSSSAYCSLCGERLELGEPCVKLDTLYIYKGSRSAFLHFRCINATVKRLRQIKKELEKEYVLWRIGR